MQSAKDQDTGVSIPPEKAQEHLGHAGFRRVDAQHSRMESYRAQHH
ncbi:hypothetical protein ACPOL_2967 [Acidisarcina polymorpha]|uniref:Uncharacterized protein n=1 Tax=Acidisarcina polymorpha TaxID=2211140 RepID=A0A2Z5FZS0_9BACT|nr:hypothetical protein ACPOL_2967 [Acidisarcina polymorpha]